MVGVITPPAASGRPPESGEAPSVHRRLACVGKVTASSTAFRTQEDSGMTENVVGVVLAACQDVAVSPSCYPGKGASGE